MFLNGFKKLTKNFSSSLFLSFLIKAWSFREMNTQFTCKINQNMEKLTHRITAAPFFCKSMHTYNTELHIASFAVKSHTFLRKHYGSSNIEIKWIQKPIFNCTFVHNTRPLYKGGFGFGSKWNLLWDLSILF